MAASLLYAPYLSLSERASITDWEFIGVDALDDGDWTSSASATLGEGLARLYEVPSAGLRMSVFVRPPDGRLGYEFDAGLIAPLRRALVVALLGDNAFRFTNYTPGLDVAPDPKHHDPAEDSNLGWTMYTSEHAQLWGHNVADDGYVAEARGAMVTTQAGGFNVLRDDSLRFAAPRELHEPMLGRSLDEEYASAVFELLGRQNDAARRLGRAIDWLELAWSNSDAMNTDLRVASLHSGFEALLGRPASTEDARRDLSALLDPRRDRPGWTTRRGRPITDAVSDLEWWYDQFARLRNAILHGDELPADSYLDDRDRPHKWVAEETLRAAIRETVAAGGWPDLRLERGIRAIRQPLREAIERGELDYEGDPKDVLGGAST